MGKTSKTMLMAVLDVLLIFSYINFSEIKVEDLNYVIENDGIVRTRSIVRYPHHFNNPMFRSKAGLLVYDDSMSDYRDIIADTLQRTPQLFEQSNQRSDYLAMMFHINHDDLSESDFQNFFESQDRSTVEPDNILESSNNSSHVNWEEFLTNPSTSRSGSDRSPVNLESNLEQHNMDLVQQMYEQDIDIGFHWQHLNPNTSQKMLEQNLKKNETLDDYVIDGETGEQEAKLNELQADLPDIFDNDNHFDIDAYLQILESSHMNQSSDSNNTSSNGTSEKHDFKMENWDMTSGARDVNFYSNDFADSSTFTEASNNISLQNVMEDVSTPLDIDSLINSNDDIFLPMQQDFMVNQIPDSNYTANHYSSFNTTSQQLHQQPMQYSIKMEADKAPGRMFFNEQQQNQASNGTFISNFPSTSNQPINIQESAFQLSQIQPPMLQQPSMIQPTVLQQPIIQQPTIQPHMVERSLMHPITIEDSSLEDLTFLGQLDFNENSMIKQEIQGCNHKSDDINVLNNMTKEKMALRNIHHNHTYDGSDGISKSIKKFLFDFIFIPFW